MSNELTYMGCWHFIAPLIPVDTGYTMDIYIMVFNALKEAEKKRIAEKGKGIECISVLHTATERAPAEIRMTAQTKLLMICQETGMLGGIGSLPVL